MKLMFDTNVFLDVFQERAPHYADSARSLSLVASGTHEGFVAAHAVTTLDYLIATYTDKTAAKQAVGWLLSIIFRSTVRRRTPAGGIRCGSGRF